MQLLGEVHRELGQIHTCLSGPSRQGGWRELGGQVTVDVGPQLLHQAEVGI